LLDLFFGLEDGDDAPSKRRLTFNGLHGVTFKKIELFELFPLILSQQALDFCAQPYKVSMSHNVPRPLTHTHMHTQTHAQVEE
jgi:hypothetical protein